MDPKESKQGWMSNTEATDVKPNQQNAHQFKTVDIESFSRDQNSAMMSNYYTQMMNQMFQFGMMPMPMPKYNSQKNSYVKEFVSIDDYSEPEKIRKAFPSCANYNDPNYGVQQLKKAEFFIIRSTNDDDLHKSIKYGIWASSFRNNHNLHNTFQACKRENIPIIFFYTVVSSDQYTGVAQMVSDVDLSKSFTFWWEESKWSGVFQVKWNIVKDLHYNNFAHLKEGDKPVTTLRDGTRLSFETGMEMLKIFTSTQTTSSIFDDFKYMDEREESLRSEREMNTLFQKSYSQMFGITPTEQSAPLSFENSGPHKGSFKRSHQGYGNRRRRDNNSGTSNSNGVYYQKRERTETNAPVPAVQAHEEVKEKEVSQVVIKKKKVNKKQRKNKGGKRKTKRDSEDIEYLKKEDFDKQENASNVVVAEVPADN